MRKSQTIAMQKVVGSSPISRSLKTLQVPGFFTSPSRPVTRVLQTVGA
jgi:hypothetical protein